MVTINYYLKGAISDKTLNQLRKEKNAGITTMLNNPLQVFLKVSGLGWKIRLH